MAQGKEWTAEERATIIQSLKPFLEAGLSRNKACESIGLTPSTLSNWVKADDSLSIKLQGWENAINIQAMANVAAAIAKEAEMDDARKETSKWWLERRMKQVFSTRVENTGADGKDLPTPVISLDVLRRDNSSTQDSSTE